MGVKFGPSSSEKAAKLFPWPPIRSSWKIRPVWWSTKPIGSERANCWTNGVETSSHVWPAGEEQSSKETRSSWMPDVKKATPPVLTLSCWKLATLGFQSTPTEGSPAELPTPGVEL